MKATISNLSVNPKKTLDSATKRQLQFLIEQEFSRQTTMYDNEISEQKRKLLNRYKKEVGFDKLSIKVSKAKTQSLLATKELESTGLNEGGDISYVYAPDEKDNPKKCEAVKRLNKMIDNLALKKPEQLRNKIVTRLWIASTIGEAIVIINEVMGNDIIPTLDTNQITYEGE